MSCCLPKNIDFINRCKSIAKKYDCDYSWNGSVECYYDASFYNRRDYVLKFTINGTAVPSQLKQELKKIGAINIIGKVRKAMVRKYVDIAFDLKVEEVKFKDDSELKYHFRDTEWVTECILYDWFERKVKIFVDEKPITYTEVLKKLIPSKMDDIYSKKIIEAENNK